MGIESFIIYFLLRCWLFHQTQLFCGFNHNMKATLKLHFCIFLFSSHGYPPSSYLKAHFRTTVPKCLHSFSLFLRCFLHLLKQQVTLLFRIPWIVLKSKHSGRIKHNYAYLKPLLLIAKEWNCFHLGCRFKILCMWLCANICAYSNAST